MDNATVKTFKVPNSVLDFLIKTAVIESVALLPENKEKPVVSDPTKAKDQYGVRPEKLKELQDKIIQGQEKMQVSDEVLQQILLERERERERERLKTPSHSMEKASGSGIARFIVSCDDVSSVLSLAKEVMTIVNSHSTQSWLSLDEWSNILPSRFVSGCLPKLTKAERGMQAQRWDNLTYEKNSLKPLMMINGHYHHGYPGWCQKNESGFGGMRFYSMRH